MKRSEFNIALATTAFLLIRSKQFVQPIMTVPTEEELAEGKVPIQMFPGFWDLDMTFEGPRGSFSGHQNVEATEEATDADLLAGVKNLYAADINWAFRPESIEEDEPAPTAPAPVDGEEPIV